jgi:hypothetical protein
MEKKSATLEERLPIIGIRKTTPAWVNKREEAFSPAVRWLGEQKRLYRLRNWWIKLGPRPKRSVGRLNFYEVIRALARIMLNPQ